MTDLGEYPDGYLDGWGWDGEPKIALSQGAYRRIFHVTEDGSTVCVRGTRRTDLSSAGRKEGHGLFKVAQARETSPADVAKRL
jgi:hypothetical protein